MKVQLAFGRQGLDVDLPGGFDYQVLDCPPIAALPDVGKAIESALDDPIAGPPLTALAKGKKSAAISVCDITRPAPNPVTLPAMLSRLLAAGVPKDGIRIMIATGLHRAATDAEIRQIVGERTAAEFTVLNHDARNLDQHRDLGQTRSGTNVFVDERFMSADLHLTLGFIEPHLMLGFSGGRKLVAPGLAGERTIKRLHSSPFMRDPRAQEGMFEDNPLHAELLEIARMARHDFILDVALNRDRAITAVFAGEPEAAHRAGMKWVKGSLMQRVGPPLDAVITTSAGYPLDLTFYQTVKGITAAAQIVKPGGKILVFGACEEGAGAAEFREMMTRYRTDAEFLQAVEGAPVTVDQWQLEKLALATQHAKVSYCVPGLPEPYMSALWGPGFRDSSEALRDFFSGLKPGSRVAVIPEGPYVLASAAAA
ncbi:MAG TPA: nickel-dependent lactate racemase [Bryobacteraceae bacterium]|jgi:nickel-dependent lactate racemase